MKEEREPVLDLRQAGQRRGWGHSSESCAVSRSMHRWRHPGQGEAEGAESGQGAPPGSCVRVRTGLVERRPFGINAGLWELSGEHRLEKGREAAAERKMLWGQAAPKLKTSFPQVLGRKERTQSPCTTLGSSRNSHGDPPIPHPR